MINFGFKINKDRQIDYDNNNLELNSFIKEYDNSINICISCGTCSATCTAGNFTQLNLRKIFVLIKRGETEGIKNEISKCMLCGKCQLACPRGVNTRNIILGLIKYYGNS